MSEASRPQAITEKEVKNLFQLWNSALTTEDPDTVAKRYAAKAVLLPTKKPQGEILEYHVTISDNW
ncbi:hypothetical protein ACHAWF_003448 [Thalassiosira exigua]